MGAPAQQQGRRIPSFSSEHTLSTWRVLVSGCLTEMVQQIHSLRASGVISSHAARAAGSDIRAFRKSAGTRCATPDEILFLVIRLFYEILHDNTTSEHRCTRLQIMESSRSRRSFWDFWISRSACLAGLPIVAWAFCGVVFGGKLTPHSLSLSVTAPALPHRSVNPSRVITPRLVLVIKFPTKTVALNPVPPQPCLARAPRLLDCGSLQTW